MNQPVLSRLIWKDIQMVKPLVIAVTAGVVAFNLIVVALRQIYWQHSEPDVEFAFWILMPNLLALGAPAMMVGTEQESGTLDWMRTLPVTWQQVVFSKFFTASCALLLIWWFASIVFWLTTLTLLPSAYRFDSELLSVSGVLYLLFYSFLLLFCGFITSFVLRSPVAALLSLIPMMYGAIYVIAGLAAYLSLRITDFVLRQGHDMQSHQLQHSTGLLLGLILGFATIALLAGLAAWFAKRRLTNPSSSFSLLKSAATDAYRPPRLASMSRTSPAVSMLWQQARQTVVYGLGILVANLMFACTFAFANSFTEQNSFIAGLGPPLAGLSFGWLGCLAFYGDGVRRQCGYFADRGVSPTLVWWTRLLPTLLIAMVLAGLWRWAYFRREIGGGSSEMIWIGMAVMFASGQMTAMWLRRPTLSFFATPVYAWLLMVVNLLLLFRYYQSHYWMFLLMIPVLLFATWHLTGRWLDERIDAGFHWRAVGYSVIALLLPFVVVVGHRWCTMPGDMSEWREKMELNRAAFASQYEPFQPPLNVFHAARARPSYRYPSSGYSDFEIAGENRFRELLELELNELGIDGPHKIGSHVGASALYGCLPMQSFEYAVPQPVVLQPLAYEQPTPERLENRMRAVEVLLTWATQIRSECEAGRLSFAELWMVAEPAEQTAVFYLHDAAHQSGITPAMIELLDLIPDSDLRRESRKSTLIREWYRFRAKLESEKDNNAVAINMTFGGYPWMAGIGLPLPFESKRGMRYLDLATSETLDYLDSGLASNGSRKVLELSQFWREAIVGPLQNVQATNVPLYGTVWTEYWTSNHEKMINNIQEMVLQDELSDSLR